MMKNIDKNDRNSKAEYGNKNASKKLQYVMGRSIRSSKGQ